MTAPLASLVALTGLALFASPRAQAVPAIPAAGQPRPPAAAKKLLTEAQALGRGARVHYYGDAPSAHWDEDGVHYVLRVGTKRLRVDPATGRATELPATAAAANGKGAIAPAMLRRRRSVRRSSPLHLIDGDLYYGDPAEKDAAKLRRLTADGGDKRIEQLSPDRAWASFVRGTNLAVVDVASGEGWNITTDGSADLMYGVLDWVYQEEVYGRGDFRAHWWSPSSDALAFLRLDESEVKTFTVIDFVPRPKLSDERTVEPEVTKYPKAGDPNPKVQLMVAWPKDRRVVPVDMTGYDDGVLVVRVGWTPKGEVLFEVQNRIQSWLDLDVADPATGARRRLLRETSNTWVNRLPLPRFLDDGSFLWLSERTGYQHIYHCAADGEMLGAVTSGEWQVRRIVRVAKLGGKARIWFTGTKDGALDDNLYRVDLDGTGLVRLTDGPGRHSVSLNGDGSWFLDDVSTIDEPPSVRLCSGDGNSVKVLGRAAPRDVERCAYSPPRLLTIPARDGYPMDASLIRPPDFDPGRKYPVYLQTYSGPDAPTVRDAFRPSPWRQYLAQQGCLILQVNVRSASGRGQVHTATCYQQLGVQELRDLEDAVDWTVANASGDPARVAVDGWSYGGFMAAYALTHSKKFCLGIAGAGVHDWQLYDTIYTERYMGLPQRNAAGYAKSSVIGAAAHLHGHLVILHGARDDNVHLQNSMRLLYELQKHDVDTYELMIYPRDRHGVRAPHKQRMILRAVRRYLLGKDGS